MNQYVQQTGTDGSSKRPCRSIITDSKMRPIHLTVVFFLPVAASVTNNGNQELLRRPSCDSWAAWRPYRNECCSIRSAKILRRPAWFRKALHPKHDTRWSKRDNHVLQLPV